MNTSNTQPIVSVVMPVYNGERYLREAIDSILQQTFTDYELIIINDGSTDDSENIIRAYTDPRIRYLINEQNSGICVTLNKGLDAAQGKFIARMDCDDISMPERLLKQVEYLEKNPEVGIVGSDIVVFGEGLEDKYFEFVHDREGCKAGLFFNTCFAHPTVMFRRSIIIDYDLRYNDIYRGLEDFELWWRVSQHSDLANISQPLLRYRKHQWQVTQNVTNAISNKEIEFHRERFLTYAQMDESELTTITSYSLAEWHKLNKTNFPYIISAFKKVIESPLSNATPQYHKAMQIMLSKAIVYMINQSHIKVNRPKTYLKALFQGIMPFDWFLKFMYHAILK